jgi:hypothetical protein
VCAIHLGLSPLANETSSVASARTVEQMTFDNVLPDYERQIVAPFTAFTKLLYGTLIRKKVHQQ